VFIVVSEERVVVPSKRLINTIFHGFLIIDNLQKCDIIVLNIQAPTEGNTDDMN
jgi:hypothetical protein